MIRNGDEIHVKMKWSGHIVVLRLLLLHWENEQDMEDVDKILYLKQNRMKKIDTDELRAQLDTFSPEQQRDMDRDLLNQYINVFRTLSGIVEQSVRNYKIISEQVDASTAKVGKLLPMLKEANTVRVDERIKSSIEKVAVKMGDDVADAFGKKVRAVLDDVNEASGRISIPLDVALACMLTLLFAILILVLVVIVNITEIHSGVLWIVLGGGFGSEILIYWLVWYLHRKGWV